MAEHENELETWNVPRFLGKRYYNGTIAVLMGVIGILMLLLYRSEKGRADCQDELKDVNSNSQKYLEKWADKAFDQRYKEKEQEKASKVEELKAVVDTIKKKI